jgi:hypothetical protein
MLHYTNDIYKIEMIELRKNMPREWINKYIKDEHDGKSDEEKKKIKNALMNTISGCNHKKGISMGYINVIRKAHADHNNKEYVPLPEIVAMY